MHFVYPQNFILLLVIPLFLYYSYKKKKEAILITVFSDLKKAQGVNRWIKISKHFKNILVVLIIALFVFILAKPQSAHQKDNLNKNGIDIIVAMDVSGSMLAEDLKPNRMTAAKEALKKFISYLSDDRLGIVVFSGVAFTQSPLTFDYNILQEYINKISIDSINQNVSGTAIGDAILVAVNRFKKSENRTKVLVILTDGDANVGIDPEIAAKKAKEEGIKIYTIGIGKDGGAPLPYTDIMGNKKYSRNQDGSLVMATFNESALKKIANIGDGKYFRVNDDNSFDKAMTEINALEKREIKTKVTTEYTEIFYPYLFALFIVFLIYIILNIKIVKK